jgi:hypothetical protein
MGFFQTIEVMTGSGWSQLQLFRKLASTPGIVSQETQYFQSRRFREYMK